MVQKFMKFYLFQFPTARKRRQPQTKLLPTPENSRFEAGKDPLNLLEGNIISEIFVFWLQQIRRPPFNREFSGEATKKPPDSVIGSSIIFETKSGEGELQINVARNEKKMSIWTEIKFEEFHPKSW